MVRKREIFAFPESDITTLMIKSMGLGNFEY